MLEQTQAQSFPFSGDLFPVVAPVQWETFFLFLINLLIFIFGCIGSSLLCGFFSSCSKQGLLIIAVPGLLIVGSFCRRGAWAGRLAGLGVAVVALRHIGSSWSRDGTRVSCIGRRNSLPLTHQRSPRDIFRDVSNS